ncbi:hypothetical protein SAMN02745857_03865 [Andreprevotia lacus DSM 23236]|uniref:Uncharacterized protein n=1 Tax=Andreprevotia lacus DSM 23236 TaxID=1121001 RepID=A0A1W1Y026_9NEIS|nr:hypothetical protein [Andreprevotia lacus]SMC29477.1 hypothetical protein SAMN02745857_03865 [Andreprevotia lacus DSM 23236]
MTTTRQRAEHARLANTPWRGHAPTASKPAKRPTAAAQAQQRREVRLRLQERHEQDREVWE